MNIKISKPFAKNLKNQIEFAKSGIVSKTLLDTDELKYILFCLEKGQRLSKHSAPFAAGIVVIKGKGKFVLGDKNFTGNTGSFFHMPPKLPHSILAIEDLVFFLVMAKGIKKARS